MPAKKSSMIPSDRTVDRVAMRDQYKPKTSSDIEKAERRAKPWFCPDCVSYDPKDNWEKDYCKKYKKPCKKHRERCSMAIMQCQGYEEKSLTMTASKV